MDVVKEPRALTVTSLVLMETMVTTARKNVALTVEFQRDVTG